jgi:hypothetical protein
MTAASFGHIVNITSERRWARNSALRTPHPKAGLIEASQVLYVCGGLTVGLILG